MRRSALFVALGCWGVGSWALAANSSPAAPTILEPESGQIANAPDLHMDTTPFDDPDPGDSHLCTDWEIWTLSPIERVWSAGCVSGPQKLHAHLGDGRFEATHQGRTDLEVGRPYRLRVRHSDDSGDPTTRWGGWSEQFFDTAPANTTPALELADVPELPGASWIDAGGEAIRLPEHSAAPSLRVESRDGGLLLELRGTDGAALACDNPPPLTETGAVRIVADAAATGLALPPSDLTIGTPDGATLTLLLPALDLAPAGRALFWVDRRGGTYHADALQQDPDFSSVARGLSQPWSAVQPDLTIEVFAEELELPVNIAFVPDAGSGVDDPFLYVTELHGKIKTVTRGGAVSDYAIDLLDFTPTGDFPGSGEQGLTGIAVDPQSGDVFAAMLHDLPGGMGQHVPKIVRFSSSDGGRTASSQTTILDMTGETQGQSHQISRLSIGPDGKLYSHMGDGFVASTAQNLAHFRGKILRMNLDGSAPADNPFYDAGDGIGSADYVYAYGVRNPFGGDWRQADGRLYEVENGPSRDRLAQVVPGRNYLWNGTNSSMEQFAIHVWNPSVGPVNLAFVQIGSFGGSGFPYAKLGRAYVSESGPTYAAGAQLLGKRISEIELDADGDLVSGPTPLVEYVGSGRATAVGLAAGPDGLYFTELYKDLAAAGPTQRGARILRVRSTRVPRLELNVQSAGPLWSADAAVSEYDLVRGDLALLRDSGGDFAQATSACAANDTTATNFVENLDPQPGAAFWYLVRDLDALGRGSYESGGPGQRGMRDSEIQASPSPCP